MSRIYLYQMNHLMAPIDDTRIRQDYLCHSIYSPPFSSFVVRWLSTRRQTILLKTLVSGLSFLK